MTATITEAKDAMLAQFNTVWNADAEASKYPIAWPDTKFDVPNEDTVRAWVRVQIIHNPGAGGQATLSGDTGQRRYRRFGVLFVQVFTIFGDSNSLSEQLVRVAMSAFEGVDLAPTGVIFRDVRFTEVGQDGAWAQTNVSANFEYDEVR